MRACAFASVLLCVCMCVRVHSQARVSACACASVYVCACMHACGGRPFVCLTICFDMTA